VEYATNDITGYSNGVHYVQLGHANHLFNGYQAVFSNLASTGSHTELKDREEYLISYMIGVNAAPEIGSTAFLSTQEQVSYEVAAGGGSQLVNVDFEKAITDSGYDVPWGTVLEAGTQRTETGDLASVDNLVASTNGFIAHLHILASTTTWTIDIESSSSDGGGDPFASVGQFSLTGAAIGSEKMAVAGAVEQYLRIALVRDNGAGNITFYVTLARGIDLDA